MNAFIPIPVLIPRAVNACGSGDHLGLISFLIGVYFFGLFSIGMMNCCLGDKVDWGAPFTYLCFPYVLGYGFSWLIFAKWRNK